MRKLTPWCGVSSLVVAVFSLAAANPAHAVDGVIEINQARADAGGINGSLVNDPAGFPVRITEPGSYVLTGNLEVTDANTTAIEVVFGPVTLDMNGFSITGPVSCITIPPVCNTTGTGVGIDAEKNGTKIRNGNVTGVGSHGILVLDEAIVEGVQVRSVGGIGIKTRNRSIVRNNNVSLVNSHGVSCNTTCLVLGNTIFASGGYGIETSIDGAYGHNVLSDNNGGGGAQQVDPAGLVQVDTNSCDGSTTCP